MEPLRDHIFLKKGSSCLWMAAGLHEGSKLDLLANPDILFSLPECEVVKDQRKIKVARIRLQLDGQVRHVYVKRYNVFSWRYRLSSLVNHSAAFRAWVGAAVLTQAGFHTGSPIAAVECRSWGMLTKSFYLSEEIPLAKTVDDYWLSELAPMKRRERFSQRRTFLKALAELFRQLHEKGIYHNDLKDANILVVHGNGRQGCLFFLLDLEGIRGYRNLTLRRRTKNLVQLNRTMGKHLRRSERLYWLKIYLGSTYLDRRARKKWLRRILRESARADARSLRKRRRGLTN